MISTKVMLSADEYKNSTYDEKTEESADGSDGSDDPRSWGYVVLTPAQLDETWDTNVIYLKPKDKEFGTSVGIRYKAPNMKGKLVNKTISLTATHKYFMPFGVQPQKKMDSEEISHYQATFSFDYNRGKDKSGGHRERLTDPDGIALVNIQSKLVRDIVKHGAEWNAGIADIAELNGKDDMFSKSKFSPIIRWAGKKDKRTGMYTFSDEWGPNTNTKIGFSVRTEVDQVTGETIDVHVLDCEYYNQDGEAYEELTNLMLATELPKLNKAVPLIDMSSIWLGEKAISIRMYLSQIQSHKFLKRAKGALRVRMEVEESVDMDADADADADETVTHDTAPPPVDRQRPSFGGRPRPKLDLSGS